MGTAFGHVAGEVASWTGLLLLGGIGLWMLREGFANDDSHEFDIRSAGGLLVASLSISLDSLGVGFALPVMRLPVLPLLATVAVSTVCFTLGGLGFGARLGHIFEKNAERGAGVVLILLAAAFAVQKFGGVT